MNIEAREEEGGTESERKERRGEIPRRETKFINIKKRSRRRKRGLGTLKVFIQKQEEQGTESERKKKGRDEKGIKK